MLKSLRRKLTLWFIGLFLVIYGCGGATAIFVFESGLSAAIDDEVEALAEEIMPSIRVINERPSLKLWATNAGHLKMPASIQLFNADGKLYEAYGPPGVARLVEGPLSGMINGKSLSLRSNYERLDLPSKYPGYLQIQISTGHRDSAINQLIFTMLVLVPFLVIAVGLTGYIFAGQAVAPVAKSMDILKRFVADAGHEFNTPVAVIEASIQTLEESLKEHNLPTDILEIISRASNGMKELAADLILLASIDSPQMELPKDSLTLDEIIQPSFEAMTELAKNKSINLTHSQIPEGIIFGNEHALKIMLSNVLSNALKYTDNSGSVHLSVDKNENNINISVKDTGIGIPKEHIENIFDRFYRVEKSRSRSAGGSGLGLSIVKAIIEVHNGNIKVESTPGKGSVFTITLPASGRPFTG